MKVEGLRGQQIFMPTSRRVRTNYPAKTERDGISLSTSFLERVKTATIVSEGNYKNASIIRVPRIIKYSYEVAPKLTSKHAQPGYRFSSVHKRTKLLGCIGKHHCLSVLLY